MSQLVDFMQDKWRFWMAQCDLKDGKMRSADWNEGAERLIEEYNLPEDRALEVRNVFKHFGGILLGDGHMSGNVEVEPQRVVVKLTGFLLTNRAQAVDVVDTIIRHIFAAVDTDQDDFINEQQFYSVCQCLLLKEKHWRPVYMCICNPETGNVNITRGTVWWVDFIMGVDKGSWEDTQAIFNISS